LSSFSADLPDKIQQGLSEEGIQLTLPQAKETALAFAKKNRLIERDAVINESFKLKMSELKQERRNIINTLQDKLINLGFSEDQLSINRQIVRISIFAKKTGRNPSTEEVIDSFKEKEGYQLSTEQAELIIQGFKDKKQIWLKIEEVENQIKQQRASYLQESRALGKKIPESIQNYERPFYLRSGIQRFVKENTKTATGIIANTKRGESKATDPASITALVDSTTAFVQSLLSVTLIDNPTAIFWRSYMLSVINAGKRKN
jgi:hypothetical protein